MSNSRPNFVKPPDVNVGSELLLPKENEVVFSLLGGKCVTLATAVVQVFLTEPPTHQEWHKYCCGVACFVKDNPQKSFFIRIYDIEKEARIWQQELYSDLKYVSSVPFFHTFEADKCMAGLNFADENEAVKFKKAVECKIPKNKRKSKTTQEKAVKSPSTVTLPVQKVQKTSQNKTELTPLPEQQKSNISPSPKKKNGNEKKRRGTTKINKCEIGPPSNFIHLQHVGFDPITGFDYTAKEEMNKKLSKLLKLAGVSQEQYSDADTKKFILTFISDHGGFESFMQESKKHVSNSVSVKEAVLNSQPPAPPAPPLSRPPAPPPPTSAPGKGLHSHPQQRGPPPPPPPPRPSPPSVSSGSTTPAPPPPPPPPLPPSADGSGSTLTVELQSDSNSRSVLMEAIRKGTTLNPVQNEGEIDSSTDARGALLSQIRLGTHLRPVTEVKSNNGTPPLEGLAGALARALQERSRVIQITDESSCDEELEEEEAWED